MSTIISIREDSLYQFELCIQLTINRDSPSRRYPPDPHLTQIDSLHDKDEICVVNGYRSQLNRLTEVSCFIQLVPYTNAEPYS